MHRTDIAHRQRMRQRRIRLEEVRKNYRAKPLPRVSEKNSDPPLPGLLPAGMVLMFILIAVGNAVRKHAVPEIEPVVTTGLVDDGFAVAGPGVSFAQQVPPPRHRAASSTNPYMVTMPDQNDKAADLGAPSIDAAKREIVMASSPWSKEYSTARDGELLQQPTSTATPTPLREQTVQQPVSRREVAAPKPAQREQEPPKESLNLEPMISQASPPEPESLEPLMPALPLEPIAEDDSPMVKAKIDLLDELGRSTTEEQPDAPANGLPSSIEDVDTGEKKVLGAGDLPMLDLTRRILGE